MEKGHTFSFRGYRSQSYSAFAVDLDVFPLSLGAKVSQQTVCHCRVLFLYFSDLQNVDITLRILFRPKEESLPHIYANIGIDFDERILPSITTEVLKAVVVSACIVCCACVCWM